MSEEREFSGKTALVTGGARGIGLAIARRLAREGAHVAIADLNREGGEQAVADLRREGLAADFVPADLSARDGAAVMVQTAAGLAGRLDILINNARAGARLSLLTETEDNWDSVVDVGLKAAFFASQKAIRLMSATGGGCIVNISSIAAILATNESPSYHAAKSGLHQLTRYLAVAAGPHHIRVNCVLPGFIVKDEHRPRFDAPDNESYRQSAAFYQPMGKVGSESDVAEAVLYLCSERARYVSGTSLVIDGGASVQEQFGLLLRQSAT